MFIFDPLSISAILVSLVTVVAVLWLIRKSNRDQDQKLRAISNTHMGFHTHRTARELCTALQSKYPHLCPGLDYTIRVDNQERAFLEQWRPSVPRRPTDQELERILQMHQEAQSFQTQHSASPS